MPILGLKASSKPVYPPHFDIEAIIRPNILALHPYRCARDDYQSGILLDANENSLGHSIPTPSTSMAAANGNANLDAQLQLEHLSLDLHRYPDPAQLEIKQRIADLRSLEGPDNVFLGVGSDEVIDLLMRVCVAPQQEKIMTTPPTYGMYAVCAQVNDIGIVKVPLNVEGGVFQLRLPEMKKAIDDDPSIKLIILCSPGNPTGTLIPLSDMKELLEYPSFKGIVIIDEAYIDFAGPDASAATLVSQYANVCVMQTLSKSFGLAAIRLGMAIAQPPLIQILSNTKAPYNISTPSANLALSALSSEGLKAMHEKASTLISSRGDLLKSLEGLDSLGIGKSIGGNDANFILVPILNRETRKPDNVRSERIYKQLAEKEGVVVRFRGKEHGCDGCIRITVGTAKENAALLDRLKDVLEKI